MRESTRYRLLFCSVGLAILGATFLGCARAPKITGELVEGAYHNKYVGLRFPLPQGWHLATDAAVEQLATQGAQVMGLDSPGAKRLISRMPGYVLLMASERPLDSDVEELNCNLILAAFDVRGHRDEISTGADYIRLLTEGLRQSLPTAVVSETTTERLDDKEFHTFEARFLMQGITAYQRQLAHVANDYLIVIVLSAGTASRLDDLMVLAEELSLSPVPEAVESSVEGLAFRRQASVRK